MSRCFVWARVRIRVSIHKEQDMNPESITGTREADIVDRKPSIRNIMRRRVKIVGRCLLKLRDGYTRSRLEILDSPLFI